VMIVRLAQSIALARVFFHLPHVPSLLVSTLRNPSPVARNSEIIKQSCIVTEHPPTRLIVGIVSATPGVSFVSNHFKVRFHSPFSVSLDIFLLYEGKEEMISGVFQVKAKLRFNHSIFVFIFCLSQKSTI